jgi:transposase
MFDSTVMRAHVSAAGVKGSRTARRSAAHGGGFGTKIHLKADFEGQPLAFDLTGGEASDSRHFEIPLDIGPAIAPRAALTDKGDDAERNREAARARRICPIIPCRSNAPRRPVFFPKRLYKTRAGIEQTISKLKRLMRIAFRCEKTAMNYGALLVFAWSLIFVKSVHAA